MSMLTRTGTVMRNKRRRSSTASSKGCRRESVPTPSPTLCLSPSPSPSYVGTLDNGNSPNGTSSYLLQQPYHGRHRHSWYSSSGHLTPTPFSPHGQSNASSPLPPTTPNSEHIPLNLNQMSDRRVSSSSKVVAFTFDTSPVPSEGRFKLTPPPNDKPVYESTVLWAEVEDPDNHYSLIGSLSEASNEARHPCEFIHKSLFILGGTWPVTVFTMVLLALPLVMTAIGVNYLQECPREPKLPIYLVVGGSFGILKLIFLLWKQIRRHRDDVIDLHDDDDLLTMTRMTNIALNVFLSVWFVFGHYWLVRIWKPHFEAPLHEPRNWCDRTVFLFTFWHLVICHIIIGIIVITSIVLYCVYICIKCVGTPSTTSANNGDDEAVTTVVVPTSSSSSGHAQTQLTITRLNGKAQSSPNNQFQNSKRNIKDGLNHNSQNNQQLQQHHYQQQQQQQQKNHRSSTDVEVGFSPR